jgi:hypothetical protein
VKWRDLFFDGRKDSIRVSLDFIAWEKMWRGHSCPRIA